MEIVIADVTGGNERTKSVEFYQDGQKVRSFRVVSELFKSKLQAKKYFKV